MNLIVFWLTASRNTTEFKSPDGQLASIAETDNYGVPIAFTTD
jgi:hypothetical protein